MAGRSAHQDAAGAAWRRSDRNHRHAAMPAAFVVVTVAGVPIALAAETEHGTATRPNIVPFLSDDMGWGQPGFNGGTEVEAPNLGRIANEGVKLTQFCVQPVCTATRSSLLTGRYPWKTGTEEIPDQRPACLRREADNGFRIGVTLRLPRACATTFTISSRS